MASKSNAVNEKENIYSLKGFSKVFKFTLTQTFKNKAYIISLVVFVLTMSLMGPIQYFSAKSSMSASESLLSNKVKDAATMNALEFANRMIKEYRHKDPDGDDLLAGKEE